MRGRLFLDVDRPFPDDFPLHDPIARIILPDLFSIAASASCSCEKHDQQQRHCKPSHGFSFFSVRSLAWYHPIGTLIISEEACARHCSIPLFIDLFPPSHRFGQAHKGWKWGAGFVPDSDKVPVQTACWRYAGASQGGADGVRCVQTFTVAAPPGSPLPIRTTTLCLIDSSSSGIRDPSMRRPSISTHATPRRAPSGFSTEIS